MFDIFTPLAPAARKALALRRDAVFGLLTIMTALLGWLAGIGAGGMVGLQQVYSHWALEKNQQISIYLTPDATEETINTMAADLSTLKGVQSVKPVSREKVEELLAPYLADGEADTLLPAIIDVKVKADVNRSLFDARVMKHFPAAEIDDARDILAAVGTGVRTIQTVAALIALSVFAVMTLLVVLTVRAGLRSQLGALSILQYVGATDSFVGALVTRQVFGCTLRGFLAAAVLGALSLGYILLQGEAARSQMGPTIWFATLGAPFLLVIVAVVASQIATRKVLQQPAGTTAFSG